MKKFLVPLILSQIFAVVLVLTINLSVSRAGNPAFTQNIAVPAYFPDHLHWDQTARNNWDAPEQGYDTTKLIVINPYDGTVDPWNPANGGFNQELKDRVDLAKARGVTVLGYTWTNKHSRSWNPYYVGTRLADIGIKQDIDNYFAWYNVDGIFVDDAVITKTNNTPDCTSVTQDNSPNDPWMAPSYQRIYNYVKAKGGAANIVALNPGIQPPECFMTASDILVNFEGSYNDYVNGFDSCCANPAWVANYAPNRFWHLIHTAPTGTNEMQNVVQLSKQRHAGWVYVTPTLNNDPVTNDPHAPGWKWLNAWDDLTNSDPNYWQAEVDTVGSIFRVTNNQNDGQGSLRDALTQANSNLDFSKIVFNIPTNPGQVVTIVPLTQLPAITAPLILDGTSQPGFAEIPLIELNGANLSVNQDCIVLSGGNSTIRGLVINRCPGNGIKITTTGGNTIQGNYIGTNAGGSAALANGLSGISVNGIPNNIIGGITTGSSNLISGNSTSGVYISGIGATGNQVWGNFIGTNVTGTAILPNLGDGVVIDGAPGNIIGGTSPTSRNLIAGNARYGVFIIGTGANNNIVSGNYIGTNTSGTAPLNNSYGIFMYAAGANTIGGVVAGSGNLISGNSNSGIFIGFGGTGNNQVLGNFIGTNANGTATLPNGANGIQINGLPNNIIGGTTAGSRNLISGNNSYGIYINGSGATGNQVLGNFIGTDFSGTTALANQGFGIELAGAPNNIIGGDTAAATNLISGNKNNGVYINGNNASTNQVLGNFIGTNASGSAAVPNGATGILLDSAPNNIIGGTTAGSRNLISGNSYNGIFIIGIGATGNQVLGNRIGTDFNGSISLPNLGNGIEVNGVSNSIIGGITAGSRNLISGNKNNGVLIKGSGAIGNQVLGNFIGTDLNGTTTLGNQGFGILVDSASNNILGGVGSNEANNIGFNSLAGISITCTQGANCVATGNKMRGNSIFSNGGLGIDLGNNGVNQNDLGDVDSGVNNLQNNPVLTSVLVTGGNLVISGTLNSVANTTLTLDFYANNACNPSGYGEGQVYLGSAQVTTDGSGNAFFSLTNPLPIGHYVSATATDNNGNTSELSRCQAF